MEQNHRHHGKVVGHKFSIGLSDGEKIVGVAIVGRPVARHLDDGWTMEVNRLCTDGTRNACSMLYAASWRAARAMGYKRKMPCMVEDADRDVERDAEADELRAIDEAILLITTNGQREKTDWDKVQEATRLRALLEKKRRFEKIPGETRKLIAEQLGTTPAQVGRYDSIEKHLIPTLKGWLEKEKIGISVAYELSMLPEEVQEHAAAALWSKGTPVTLEDVRKWKPAEREQPKTERTEPKPAEDGQEYKPGAYVRTEPTKMTTVPPDGKIVDFPAPVSPPPVEDAPPEETGREQEKDIEWAALMLKTLRNYCETMAAVKGGQTVPWAEYAEAVGIAIAALRK